MTQRTALGFDGYVMDVVQRRGEVWDDESYPFNLPAVRSWQKLELHDRVTFLVGENGSGKSTLMEAIAIAAGFNPEGGGRNFNFETADAHSELHRHLRLVRSPRKARDGYFLRAESYFNLATQIDKLDEEPLGGARIIDSYGGVSLHGQSHGESFMALLDHRFGGQGLYILDEPEAALSPQRLLAFLARLHQLVRSDSQFIIATHSPILLAYPDAWIYEMTGDGPCRRKWDELEHVTLTRDFLNNPDAYLWRLLEEESD